MPSKVIKWLNKSTSSESIDELITWMYDNVKLLEDIEEVLEKLSSSLISEVCQRLFTFYKSQSYLLQRFTVFLLPSLLYSYLCHTCEEDTAVQSRKVAANPADAQQNTILCNITALESCLIAISRHYLKLNPKLNSPKCMQSDPAFSIPSLNEASVFHNTIAESAMDINEPLTHSNACYSFTGGDRASAIAFLIRDYVDTLTSTDILGPMNTLISMHAMSRYCKLCDRVAGLTHRPRLPANSNLLNDLLLGLDVILYKLDDLNRRTDDARRSSITIRTAVWDAIKQIEKRATYNCMSGPLLIARAILHHRTAQYGSRAISGARIADGSSVTMDISALMTSSETLPQVQNTVEISGNRIPESSPMDRAHNVSSTGVITNASFRPETLPEDIPISEKNAPHSNHNANHSVLGVKSRKAEKAHSEGKQLVADHRHRGAISKVEPSKPPSGFKVPHQSAKRTLVE